MHDCAPGAALQSGLFNKKISDGARFISNWIRRRTKAGACKWARKHNYGDCADARVQSIYPLAQPIEWH